MKAEPNQVYVYYSERERLYVAYHVVDVIGPGKLATIVPLDWVGHEPPTKASLQKALWLTRERFAYMSVAGLVTVTNRVPAGWTLWGELPAKVDTMCMTFSDWSAHDMLDEHRWRSHPIEVRRRYKDAADSHETVTFLEGVADGGGKPFAFPRSTGEFRDDRGYVVADDFDLRQLHALPALTRVRLGRPRAWLCEWLAEAPLIRALSLGLHGAPRLDLRNAGFRDLSVDVTGVERLLLPASLDRLTLRGTMNSSLHIEAADDGRWVSLSQPRDLPDFSGMDALGGVELREVRALDVAALVQRFPRVEELRISGAPGHLTHVGELGKLSELTELTLQDAFGFGAADFPPPSALPQLDRLWLTSIPADVAAAVKKAFGKLGSLDVSVRQPRKPEWLAENLDNPFRDWDGRENITPANAKKAAKAYRTLVSGVRAAVTEHTKNAKALERAADELVEAYIAVFNNADKRTGFIETVEREEVIAALAQGLAALPADVDREGLLQRADVRRDF